LHKSQNTSATSAEQKAAPLLGLLWLIPVMQQNGSVSRSTKCTME
jgi:hypothetical protein